MKQVGWVSFSRDPLVVNFTTIQHTQEQTMKSFLSPRHQRLRVQDGDIKLSRFFLSKHCELLFRFRSLVHVCKSFLLAAPSNCHRLLNVEKIPPRTIHHISWILSVLGHFSKPFIDDDSIRTFMLRQKPGKGVRRDKTRRNRFLKHTTHFHCSNNCNW